MKRKKKQKRGREMPIKKQEIRILDFLFEPQRSNFSTKSITVFTKK